MTQIAIKAQIEAIKKVTAEAIKSKESPKEFLKSLSAPQRPSSTATATTSNKK